MGIAILIEIIRARAPQGLATGVMAGLVLALGMPIYSHVQFNYLRPDTRNLALEWVAHNVPSDAFILREWDTPEIERVYPNRRIHFTGIPFEQAALADWHSRGVSVVLISTRRTDFYRQYPDEYQRAAVEYDRLKREWRLVQSFEPSQMIKGPAIYIYRAPELWIASPF
jgi:hypothetical protein